MRIQRRQVLQLAAGGAAAMALPAIGKAREKPLFNTATVVGGFTAGGTVDTLARLVAHNLTGLYADSMVVENRTGAGGQIAARFVARAAPDGRTFLATPMSILGIYTHTYDTLPYSIDDLVPVSLGCVFEYGLAVGPAVPASVTTVPEFFKWVTANPSQANFGSPASGSVPHLVGDLLGRKMKVPLQHIAFRGTPSAIVDMIGGQIPAVSGPLGEFLPHIKEGRVRVLGVMGSKRSKFMPDVPTMVEQGIKDFVYDEWVGFYVPRGTPQDVIARLNADLKIALKSQDTIDGLALKGLDARWSTPEQLQEMLDNDTERWGRIVRKIGFKAQN